MIYDYFIAKTQMIILHYCIISKMTIIPLFALLLLNLFFPVHIIAIIVIILRLCALYYCKLLYLLFILVVLLRLYFPEPIICIMHII